MDAKGRANFARTHGASRRAENHLYLVREPFVFLIHLKMDWQHERFSPKRPRRPISFMLRVCRQGRGFPSAYRAMGQGQRQLRPAVWSAGWRAMRSSRPFFREAFANSTPGSRWARSRARAIQKTAPGVSAEHHRSSKAAGFSERGNHWRLPYRACAVMDFHAQKSSHSDTYYLRFCLSHRDASRACCSAILRPA